VEADGIIALAYALPNHETKQQRLSFGSSATITRRAMARWAGRTRERATGEGCSLALAYARYCM